MAAKKRPDTIAQLRHRLDRARTPERKMAAQLALGRALRESDPTEAQRLLEEVLNQTSPENHPAFHTRAATSLASVHSIRGERSEEQCCAEAALKAAQTAGSRRGEAVACVTLGTLHWKRSELDRARECYERGLALARATGHLHARWMAASNLAGIEANQGRLERAVELYHEALDVGEHAADPSARAQVLCNLSGALGRLGREDEAAEKLYRSVELSEEYGPAYARLVALYMLAELYRRRGDVQKATQFYGEAMGTAEAARGVDVLGYSLIGMGQMLVEAGDLAAGKVHLEHAQALVEQAHGQVPFRIHTDVALAGVAIAEARLSEATSLLESAEKLATSSGQRHELGSIAQSRALLAVETGQVALARQCFEHAGKLYSESGDNYELARLRLDWGRWLMRLGEPDGAAVLLEQAAASARKLGATVIAERATSLLFELKQRTDREAALIEGLAGLSLLGLDPTTRLERMCEMVARAGGYEAAVVLLGGEPAACYGRPDAARAKRAARKGQAVTDDTHVLLTIRKGSRPLGAAWFERSTPSGLRLSKMALERVAHFLSEPLVLLQQAHARFGLFAETGIPGLRFHGVVGKNQAALESLKLVPKLARTSVPVLIRGESGTGKELVARALHDSGPRWDKPFVAVNCAAVPAGLLEAEFFGVEKGAATGITQRPGKFEQAHQGTIFLDEIGDMSLELQARLLRVLQEKTFERVGGTKQIIVDVRVVAATNKNLEQMVKDGRFREDLYYRLNGCEMTLPPLRERREDIPALARYFISRCCHTFNRDLLDVDAGFVEGLQQYDWPGNVRELHHTIERCALTADGRTLTGAGLPAHVKQAAESTRRSPPTGSRDERAAAGRAELEEQKKLILDSLKSTKWNVRAAAKLAGYGHSQFYRLLKKHNIKGSRGSKRAR